MEKAIINTRISITETAYQNVIAGDGSKQVIEREKESGYYYEDIERKMIFSKELGYGFEDENGNCCFKHITDKTIENCIRIAKHHEYMSNGWTKEDMGQDA